GMAFPLYESNLKSLKLLGRGKVRDMYAVDCDRLLIVTSDRLSAFDVVLPDPIPDKGRVLNEMSNFWFRRLGHIVPNHLDGAAPESVVKGGDEAAQVKGRAVVVKRLKPLPIEAVVRGYLIGSGWKDYQKTGAVCGIPLPAGLARRSVPTRFEPPVIRQAIRARLSGNPGLEQDTACATAPGGSNRKDFRQVPRSPTPSDRAAMRIRNG